MPSPLTPSWELIKAIAARLQVIRTDAGYRTELGAAVYVENGQIDNPSSPVLVVTATSLPVDTERSTPRQRAGSIEIAIEAYIPATRIDAQSLAHAALADIGDAFPHRQRELSISTGNTGIEITGRTILPRPEGAAHIVAQVTARAGLVERPIPRDL